MSAPAGTDWGLEVDDKGDVHVFPLNDLLDHEGNDDTCACLPHIEINLKTFKYRVMHNAWDGRE